jgi:hypothetical protein
MSDIGLGFLTGILGGLTSGAGRSKPGDVTAGNLGFTSQLPEQKITQPDVQQPEAPEAETPPAPPLDVKVPATGQRPQLSTLEKPFSEFTPGDYIKFALGSGLMAMGGQSAVALKQRTMAAKAQHNQEVSDFMVRGLNAVKDIKDPERREKAGRAIAARIAKIGGLQAAQSFNDIFQEPAVQGVIFSPETIQEFGSVKRAMAARNNDPKAFRSRAITANIGTIESELLKLRETNPNVAKMDSNENGVITSAEARNWVRQRVKNGDTDLTLEHMNVIQMPEFEPFLADIFDARTTKATAGAQEKDMKRAINREGKLVFVTEEQLRRDKSLTPEAKKPLVQFGTDKKSEALFDSLVKRRDDLRQQASVAMDQIDVARKMRETAQRIQTGVGTETISDLKSGAATLARLAGADSLASKIDDPNLTDAETLRALNTQAASAFLSSEKGGQISNAERQMAKRTVPGLTTTQAGNIALSHLMEGKATAQVEEAAFIDAVTEQVALGRRASDTGAQKAFHDYVNDIPRTTGEGATIRHVDDGQSLWRYYLDGRPKKWIFPGGEFTLDQVKEQAKKLGIPLRQFLGAADRKGSIQGVRH